MERMMGVENLELLIKALEYIENNLTQPLKTEYDYSARSAHAPKCVRRMVISV